MRSLLNDFTPVLYVLPDQQPQITLDAAVIQLVPPPNIKETNIILKRCFDVVFSLFALIVGLPVFILLFLITKFSSSGPALYSQVRLGRFGKPFTMYKFRSMYVDAEMHGPCLSSQNDPRITPWGRLMRITRLDELPQFWNVLKGDMSIVGPRPERKHFADQIVERNPNYIHLSHIKPGLTSLGQVVFGYAENVDEMCIRMQYDLRYLRNMSLTVDLRIIAATVKVMLNKKGK